MQIKRKWATRIGVLAVVGMGLWMRELASWRPVTVARFEFQPAHLRISRDGKKLFVKSDGRFLRAVVDLQSSRADMGLTRIRAFERENGEEYPRLSFDNRAERVIFQSAPGKKVVLHDLGIGRDLVAIEDGKSSRVGWSKVRREVYLGFYREIYVWDWDSGKLKKRVRYGEDDSSPFTFSPDGKWMIVGGQGGLSFGEFRVSKLENPQVFWSANRSGPAKWLDDGRIGIVTTEGFEWRSASGGLIRRLPGPFRREHEPDMSDWVLSPDGKWIYSAEGHSTIRRWRAK